MVYIYQASARAGNIQNQAQPTMRETDRIPYEDVLAPKAIGFI